jgi:hypothetical protein
LLDYKKTLKRAMNDIKYWSSVEQERHRLWDLKLAERDH